jgi:alpha-glucosidase
MSTPDWWKEAVFYQIYPRSFADNNGDGIGDFPGITSRLDYLQDLGVDALWISPCFPSPLFDIGYDISDYTSIAPEYGTLEDFQVFLNQAHQRGLRVILDLVLNHTSHLHPWFLESRSSRTNPKRDWYIWRDGVAGAPPNNWDSTFGGPAWEYDSVTGQYYYHFFFKEQPDLNWRNPEVKQAMWDAVRFWLKLGVDGYRLDAIGTIFEDPLLADHTASIGFMQLQARYLDRQDDGDEEEFGKVFEKIFERQVEFPEVHDLMKELRQVVDEFPGRVLVGENDLVSYYGNGNDELHLVFNFPLMRTNRLTPDWVRANQVERLGSLPPGAWPCNTLGNHDGSRLKSAFGDGQHNDELARLSFALLMTLRGTPFLYYGEEIGMTDTLLEYPEQLRDNLGVFVYESLMDRLRMPAMEAMAQAAKISRDRCRTPMQWENTPGAGFTRPGALAWLPLNPNYREGINVADQINQPDSLLFFYKQLLQLRKNTPALLRGEYQAVDTATDILAFRRESPIDGQVCLVILNMSDQPHKLELKQVKSRVKVLYSNHKRRGQMDDPLWLEIAPFEIYIGELISKD